MKSGDYVVYCTYAKDHMDHWIEVETHKPEEEKWSLEDEGTVEVTFRLYL